MKKKKKRERNKKEGKRKIERDEKKKVMDDCFREKFGEIYLFLTN